MDMIVSNHMRGLLHCRPSLIGQCESLNPWDGNESDSHAFYLLMRRLGQSRPLFDTPTNLMSTNHFLRRLCAILLLLFGVLYGRAETSNATINGILYSIDTATNEAAVDRQPADFTCHNLVIPSAIEVDGQSYTVTAIGAGAFRDCAANLSGTLTIPESITSIGQFAFSSCSGFTGDLSLPEGITSIGTAAFSNCSGFTGDLIIPSGVTSIENLVFYSCSGFNGTLTLPEGVTFIGNAAFQGCSGLTGNLVIPNSVTSIGGSAFNQCSGFTGSLIIPEGITSIGDAAFTYCSGFNGTLTLPESVTSIGYRAFQECSGFTGDLVIPNGVTSIGFSAFQNCRGFNGTLTLPEGITSIEQEVFSGCRGLTGSLTIPQGVTSIGAFAFTNCPKIKALKLPGNLQSIGQSAFSSSIFETVDCDAVNPPSINAVFNESTLERAVLTVPDGSVDQYKAALGWSDFLYITSESLGSPFITVNGLKYVVDAATNTAKVAAQDNDLVMENLNIPASINVNDKPCAVTEILPSAFYNNIGITGTLTLPESLTAIGKMAFEGCSGLTGSLTIPQGVTSIGEEAFFNCGGFNGTLTIPENLSSLEFGTFGNCIGFTGSLTIPGSVTSIGNYAFGNCRGFNGNLTISEGVISIGLDAFQDCSGFIGDLVIPQGVTSIGAGAFLRCSGFNGTLTLPSTLVSIGRIAFDGCNFTGPLTIPQGITSIEANAFQNCTGITGTLSIPSTVESIGELAFYGCTAIEELILGTPKSGSASPNMRSMNINADTDGDITDAVIANQAFGGCTNLKRIYLHEGVSAIGTNAFGGCDNLQTVQCDAPTPPAIDTNGYAFSDAAHANATLIVPEDYHPDYKTAHDWQEFSTITTLAIEDVVDDLDNDQPVEVYDLKGIYLGDSLDNLTKGIYIIRNGSKTYKVLISK